MATLDELISLQGHNIELLAVREACPLGQALELERGLVRNALILEEMIIIEPLTLHRSVDLEALSSSDHQVVGVFALDFRVLDHQVVSSCEILECRSGEWTGSSEICLELCGSQLGLNLILGLHDRSGCSCGISRDLSLALFHLPGLGVD